MLSALPSLLLLVINFPLFLFNVVLWGFLITVFSIIKAALPIKPISRVLTFILHACYRAWAWCNQRIMNLTNAIDWQIEGAENLKKNGWYLLVANHQSWMDIFVLTQLALWRIPPPKFFLKESLKWVPLIGSGCWGLDMPFMRRYTRAFLEKNPHLKGKDIETTRRSCEKFKHTPTSIINFVEGTRITAEKQKNSPFTYLLSPRAGGIAFTLAAMEEQFEAMLNITLIYPGSNLIFWDMLNGRLKKVIVHIEMVPMTEIEQGDYFNDDAFKEKFQHWLNERWQEKDALIAQKLREEESGSQVSSGFIKNH